MDMDQDEHEHEHSGDDGSDPETASTRAGKRVAELQQNVAALLHFAGCTLASLHPDPLSSFTVREIATDDTDDDDDDGEQQESSHGRDKKPATTPKPDHQQDQDEAKLQEFAKYAEGYFATLNDVQLALRTSIRHLRVARTSARALTDPNYGSLLVSRDQTYVPSDQKNTAAPVGPGGVAFDGGLGSAAAAGGDERSSAGKEQKDADAAWDMRASRLPSSLSSGPAQAARRGGSSPSPPTMSVAALELERDALQELVGTLEARTRRS
ncbi:hypothetical protein B0A53_01841 [Rhodotorula sp. CCFEE 5036]|nr:hypothetical protein B0A53_01841 [Rhodotorula sp. CCFEE 5036]